jgi:hypothetical protein
LEFLVAFALAGVLALCAAVGTAFADSQIAVYGGWNDSFDTTSRSSSRTAPT